MKSDREDGQITKARIREGHNKIRLQELNVRLQGGLKLKDTVLRGIVLQKYYEKRRGSAFTPKPEDFLDPISFEDILAISDQLGEHGLIDWKKIRAIGGVAFGHGKITAFGIDVIEGEAIPDIKVEFVQNKNINISGSSNIVIGDHNKQNISQNIQELARTIDESQGTQEQKAEAKSLLRKFAEHPLVSAIVGGALGAIGN